MTKNSSNLTIIDEKHEEKMISYEMKTAKECVRLCKKYIEARRPVTNLQKYQIFDLWYFSYDKMIEDISVALIYQQKCTSEIYGKQVYTFPGYYDKYEGDIFSQAEPTILYLDWMELNPSWKNRLALTKFYSKIWVEWKKKG